MLPLFDPIALAQSLIRAPSVTPQDCGLVDSLAESLAPHGFSMFRRRYGEVENVYFHRGPGPHLCFAGHLDVVPPGDVGAWRHPPFAAAIEDGWLYGRGAADMKGAIAAFVSAATRPQITPSTGGLSLLLTLDEEGPAIDGTAKILPDLAAAGLIPAMCVVGEPTSTVAIGDTVKNGRRGSLNAVVTVKGQQGHVAYPDAARNPVSALIAFCAEVKARQLDAGSPGFQPSNLEVTSLDVGNPTHNLIPANAQARLNMRFNPAHNGAKLAQWLRETLARVASAHGVEADIAIAITGEPFYTEPGRLTAMLGHAVTAVTAQAPILSTSGGTSDARFIRHFCPVAELGLQNATAHQVDERVRVEDIHILTRIYAHMIDEFLQDPLL